MYDFSYFGHAMLKQKINIFYRKPFKNSLKMDSPTCIDLGANLAPFWEVFGCQVGAKLAPNRSKSRSKKLSKKFTF